VSESRIERSVRRLLPRKLKDHVRHYIAQLALKGIVGSHNATSLIKYLPFRRGEDYVIPKKPAATAANGLPVPPPEQRLYGESAELHLEDGRQSWEQIVDMLQTDGKIGLHGKRILEFGCANGRLLRHFEPFAKNCEIWGVDINSKSIYWCKQNLSPPFNFVTVTTIPHLPFEDRFFDVIYAGSVFTHIDDLADAWFLEIRRVLAIDGLFCFTIHDRNTIKKMETTTAPNWRAFSKDLEGFPVFQTNKHDFGMIAIGRDDWSQIFYDMEYLKKSLENIFEIIAVREGAFGLQTAVLVRRKHFQPSHQMQADGRSEG